MVSNTYRIFISGALFNNFEKQDQVKHFFDQKNKMYYGKIYFEPIFHQDFALNSSLESNYEIIRSCNCLLLFYSTAISTYALEEFNIANNTKIPTYIYQLPDEKTREFVTDENSISMFNKIFNSRNNFTYQAKSTEEALNNFFSVLERTELSRVLKDPMITIANEQKNKTGVLDLSNHNLEAIPKEIAKMTWLTELLLFENNIQKIEHLEKLTKLKVLKLYRNQIRVIENIEKLVNLTYLTLRENNITEITGLEKLTKLTRLNLSNNQIRSIKPLLPFIRKNKPIKLEHSYDTNEEVIVLADNPIAEPPKEKIAQGNSSILQFFMESTQYGKETLDIVKVILVGNSNVGKSDLSRFLRDKDVSKTHVSTEVLDIQPWETEIEINEENRLLKVYLYDFGGQDYYHDAHQMYYSEDTAYILLWDADSNQFGAKEEKKSGIYYNNYPLPYWLESIKYNLENKKSEPLLMNTGAVADFKNNLSPVLVLQNKIDIKHAHINQEELSTKFKNIWGFYDVALREKKRTKILKEIILEFIQSNKIAGRELIAYESLIFHYFIDHNKSLEIYTIDEFANLCKRIINDENIPFDNAKAKTIAKMLNNSGLVYFDETNSNIYSNVLEFNKSIKEVMQVAKDGNDKGIFSLKQLKANKFAEPIIKLLCLNNSIIELNTNEYVAPQFLPLEPDQNISFFLKAFKYNQIRYLYPAYFHKSILLKLFAKYIVKNDPNEANTKLNYYPFWRNGIIIRKIINNVEETVLVEFEKNSTRGIIKIKTMKPFSKQGLEMEIMNEIDKLNKGWTVSKEISSDSITFFDIEELKLNVKNGIFEFAKNDDNEDTKNTDVNLGPKLTKKFGVNDFKNIVDFENLPSRVFISYSSKNTEFIQRFTTHIEVLKSNKIIDYWYDRKIEPGAKWDETIKNEMDKADIFIFMLSPDFLATNYIFESELPKAIEQNNKGMAKLFFVELQKCGWKYKKEINEFQQTITKDGTNKDLITIENPNNDKGWNEITDLLVTIINEKKEKK